MKVLRIHILLIFIFTGVLLAQDRPSGEYEASIDSVRGQKTWVNIQINEDYSYSLQVRDPSEIRTETGCWNIEGDKVTLTPDNSSDYYDLRNSLLDKILPGRALEVKEEGLLWRVKDKPAILLKKIRKCNC
ncbi:MAG: copper resistance protein NlpE [Ignavibacteria bacterium]|jgi:hypothetical protein|nr:copper resistance protein NlpE [Ignavibacteria bacterium]MCU7514585.1 copper resistance protein NlpE [Ignavibacteria bacterium]